MRNNGHRSHQDFGAACRQAACRLINKYDWTLLSEAELAAQIAFSSKTDFSPDELEKKIMRCYMTVLYQVCLQTKDTKRREQGYRELHRCLFRVAHNHRPEIAEDAAQRALVLIHEQITCCQNPGAFLAFALCKLRHAYQTEQRINGRKATTKTLSPDQTSQDSMPPNWQLDAQEDSQILVEAVNRLPDRRQKKIILGKYFEGISDGELSRQLEITTGYLRVLRHRAIEYMRQDKQLRHHFFSNA